MSDKIKVVGYAKKVTYTDGIEYRNFSPDLVGLQLTSDGGSSLFTLGNFAITTNEDERLSKIFTTPTFSNFITLSNLNVTLEEANSILNDNTDVILNLDRTNLDYYALFGSLSEYVRVSLENIIIEWPASLYLSPVYQDIDGQPQYGYSVNNYTYDPISNTSTFSINTNLINNKFGIVYTSSGSLMNTFNETNTLRNLTLNYESYVILNNNNEYPILGFTASTTEKNDNLFFIVNGKPFDSLQNSQYLYYHIKPSKINEELFFNRLSDFESYLLSRNTLPLYTSSFKYPLKSELGVILYVTDSITWPVTDGYNIDFDTTEYTDFASKLLDIASYNDLVSSNLMNRFLVSESISAFDTSPVHLSDLDQDTSGQKMNKTLQIYGRNFDELNRYIQGIEFANTVTYDKENNAPDKYLKNLARVLGWELISSVFENDLLKNFISSNQSTYSGQSIGLTSVEADIELWRRIILNTPWIWKSKGTRKVVEFFLKFIGAPTGLIEFNEYIYKANAPLNIELLKKVLELNGLDTDLSFYPIDSNGFPRFFPNTSDMYFQNDGLWYRETGGTGSTIDILSGNNPHLGPYDGGNKYLSQLTCLIPNFTPVMLSSNTITTNIDNLYTNYDLGEFNFGVTTATTVDSVVITNQDGSDIEDCVVFTPSIVVDPNPTQLTNECGCVDSSSDKVLSLCIDNNTTEKPPCSVDLANYTIDEIGLYDFNFFQYNSDGTKFLDNNNEPIYSNINYISQECCSFIGGVSHKYDYVYQGKQINSGFVCCVKDSICDKTYK